MFFWRDTNTLLREFQSQRGSLACMLFYLHDIPQIHLWCDTCRPLNAQWGGWSHSLLAFFRSASRQAVHSATATGQTINKVSKVLSGSRDKWTLSPRGGPRIARISQSDWPLFVVVHQCISAPLLPRATGLFDQLAEPKADLSILAYSTQHY